MADELEAKDFNEIADAVLDKEEKETPGASSSSQETAGQEAETTETSGPDQTKTEQVKAVEADKTLSVEDKIEKIKEILGDDLEAIDAYIKEKGYHNDPAWKAQRALIDRLKKEKEAGALSDEDKAKLDEFKKVTSSREYVEASMKAQGFTQEAINRRLKEMGYSVEEKPQNDLQLICSKLNIDSSKLTPQQKGDIEDFASIANIIFQDRIEKILPEKLKPLEEPLGEISRSNTASRFIGSMKEMIAKDNVLSFEKDIEPELNKFLDQNPEATQEEVFLHFKNIYHDMAISRLRVGKKQEERTEKKVNLRQINTPSGGTIKVPEKTGDPSKDADAILDALGVPQ